jgi:putative transposase
MERKQFNREFKAQAVRLCEQGGVPIAQVARELGINVKLLYRWRNEAQEAGTAAFPGHGHSSDEEVRRLRRELARVEMERDILKSLGGLVTTRELKYRFMQRHRQQYPVRMMCRVFSITASGYYRWCQQPQSERAAQNQQLLGQIQMVHQQSRQTYGSPKIQQALRQQGVRCGRNRIMRLMRQGGLASKRQRCFQRTMQVDPQHRYAPNHLQQRFVATAPNQVWLTDITYIATQEGWLYLAAVLDLYSRRIVGWAMDHQMTYALNQQALQMALRQRRPQTHQLLHHSDRGSQYTSADYQQLLAKHRIQVSMSGTGNCYDNAPMESFFAQLKTEQLYHYRYPSRRAAMSSIFAYIEGFYNPHRLHGTLGYLSPATFEAAFSQHPFAYLPVH